MLQSHSPGAVSQPDLRQLLEDLYQGQNLSAFRAGELIPLRDQEIWIVYRGVVQLSTLHANGDEALLGLASPCMPIGLPMTLINPYQASALTDVDLLCVTLQTIDQSPGLSQEIFHQLGRRLRQAEAMLALASCRRVEDRLRQLLVLLEMEVGQPGPGGTRLSVRLTHQHLASAIGTTRVTVTRLLGQLRAAGEISFDPQRHLIITPSRLHL
jgi:CRP-like cAMP-binding protein